MYCSLRVVAAFACAGTFAIAMFWTNEQMKKKLKSLASTLSIVVLLLLLVGGYWQCFMSAALAQQSTAKSHVNPLFPPEMNAVAVSKGDVIGDLGGVKVRVPAHFANYVEYDGDPGFGEKREGSVPTRNFQSKLMSFGFEVRFPDMAGRTTPELWQDFERKTLRDSQWMHVGFTSGSIYPGEGFLDRFVKAKLRFKAGQQFSGLEYEEYEKLPQLEYGLTAYATPGIDPKTQRPLREHKSAEDLFVLRDSQGHVVAAISCANRNFNPTCKHRFSMEPKMKSEVSIRYRRGLLPLWREIQTNVSGLIEDFEIKAETVQPTQLR